MKKFIGTIMFLLIVYVLYYDLSIGTLPAVAPKASEPITKVKSDDKKASSTKAMDFVEVTVKPGDTLLSLIEKREGKLSQSIPKIIDDFILLNDGLAPDQIQMGKKYKIPTYQNAND
ncbi:LysM peptidoglycan-binding domain-containing protein [Peribacillus alkalitolerans]|uniref:LysM peptidoglycan-binding domain-containing protein n=1 Tax=Peribacillus alkalitolerans TaxID=1550385 RepID=UPI0013D3F716|nr:LysM domain-containing protein [Peribacillus alkalitolerans]